MSKIKEALKRRPNLAVQYVIYFLDKDLIVRLWEHIKELAGDEQDEARAAFISDNATIRTTVTRFADKEVEEAEEPANDYLLSPELRKTMSAGEASEQDSKYRRARRKALWPLLMRSIVKAEELTEGKWVDVELRVIQEYLGLVSSTEKTVFLNEYMKAATKDAQEAVKSPGYFRPGVQGSST